MHLSKEGWKSISDLWKGAARQSDKSADEKRSEVRDMLGKSRNTVFPKVSWLWKVERRRVRRCPGTLWTKICTKLWQESGREVKIGENWQVVWTAFGS